MKKLNLILAFILLFAVAGCDSRKCLRSHTEQRHQPDTWRMQCITYDANGNCMGSMLIIDPGYNYNVTVCDVYEEKKNETAR